MQNTNKQVKALMLSITQYIKVLLESYSRKYFMEILIYELNLKPLILNGHADSQKIYDSWKLRSYKSYRVSNLTEVSSTLSLLIAKPVVKKRKCQSINRLMFMEK